MDYNTSNEYDVAIIGAGISGLIAGNYLAKAGLKVVIFEHHYAVGGCCSFFQRKGFTFECGAHSLSSCRPGGILDRIFSDIGVKDKLAIHRASCSDTIITTTKKINFAGGVEGIIENLTKNFPGQSKEINQLFDEINNFGTKTFLAYYTRYKNSSFKDVLRSFISNDELISVLCIFLGNLGLSSSQIGAIPAIALYREFILDGGYYVEGGMKILGHELAKNYRSLGGVLSLNNKVNKIVVKNSTIEGIVSAKSEFVKTKYVISTGGLRQTFIGLISQEEIPSDLAHKINSLKPSVSAVIMYLGVKGSPVNNEDWGRTVWYVPKNNADDVYGKVFNGSLDETAEVMLLGFPSKYDKSLVPLNCENIMCILAAPFQTPSFWHQNKTKYTDVILNRISEIIPNVKQRILVQEVATPPTVFNYTLNDDGAVYGLASTNAQVDSKFMPQRTFIDGLYLSSHWSTQGFAQGGVAVVAQAGKQVSSLIQKNKSRKKAMVY